MNSEFYINLPSNTYASAEAVRTNTTSQFRVRLPREVRLSGDWEVALVEIQFPYSWNNISKAPVQIPNTLAIDTKENEISIVNYKTKGSDSAMIVKKAYLPEGNYNDVSQIITAIERSIDHLLKRTEQSEHLRGALSFQYDTVIQ